MDAVRKSLQTDRARLSIRIANVQKLVNEAARLALARDKGDIDFFTLSDREQQMIEEYDKRTGARKELEQLLAEKAASPPYPGAGVVT